MSDKITAVITSRNDNYGENLVERATLCLNSMRAWFNEVIYVDWNSPTRSLLEEIKGDLNPNGCPLKHIVVTKEQAAQLLPDPKAQNCCEVLGRNIGIRRASNDWIVSTNIDIIPTPLLFTEDVPAGIEKNTFYTVARYNLTEEVWKQLLSIKTDVAQITERLYQHRHQFLQMVDATDGVSQVVCCGDFQIAHRSIWEKIRGFEESMVYRAFADTNVMLKARVAGFNLAKLGYTCYHCNHYNADYYKQHEVKPLNDKRYITEWGITKNNDTWGFSNVDFQTEIIQ